MLRRDFIGGSLKLLGGLAAARISYARPAGAVEKITVQLADTAPAAIIPPDFCGLGYEMSSIATPGLLSVDNRAYVQLVRNLGLRGILRFGGIVSDYSRYEPSGESRAEPEDTVFTKRDVERVSAFLHKLGWSSLWSVNFGRGSLDDAIREARDVAAILGDRLYGIELGNEVNGYGLGSRPRRPSPYTFEEYLQEYKSWHAAIAKAVPGVRFAAPDVVGAVGAEWAEQMAQSSAGEVQLLTLHYYRNGQRNATEEQLRLPDPALAERLRRMQQASTSSGIPWRMCETNSFSGGGRPGLSDSLLGALWTLDYLLLLALHGCAGVNMETGVNQLGFISSYSPIQDDLKGHNFAGTPYYGMLAFALAISDLREIYRLTMNDGPSTLTAYALGAGKRPQAIVVVNRDPEAKVEVSFAGLRLEPAKAISLAGGADGKAVTLGGGVVDSSGEWTPSAGENVRSDRVLVEPMSAVVIRKSTKAQQP